MSDDLNAALLTARLELGKMSNDEFLEAIGASREKRTMPKPKAEDLERLHELAQAREGLLRALTWAGDREYSWSLYQQDHQQECHFIRSIGGDAGRKLLTAALDIVTEELVSAGIDCTSQEETIDD